MAAQLSSARHGESWVLVLYTGGTIGMTENEDGALAPATNQLEGKIRELWQMNDPEYLSRYSHMPDPPLCLPCQRKNENRILYRIKESQPLLDSSNMSMKEWILVANEIKENYEKYDGFVVLHGTDTLSYTASALSFMLENLGKTVVVTGSQVPIFEIRSDGINNFLSSLLIAGSYVIPEVTVFFSHQLFRGNRTTKVSTDSDHGFDSPNIAPLATVGINIEVNFRQIFRPNSVEKFSVHSELNQNVGLLRIFPNINVATVKCFLQPPTEGVVLQSYGAGNIPDNRKDILSAMTEAAERGVIMINCTQCLRGSVASLYATSQMLAKAGVIPGYDMTPEAALTKLSYVLSKKEWDLETKKKMMSRNIRGELTKIAEEELDVREVAANLMNVILDDSGRHVRDAFVVGPMLMSAAAGDVQKFKYWEKLTGGNVSMCNADLRTPLHLASCEGHEELVNYILSRGASIHLKDRFGHTPLDDAIVNNQHKIIKLLLKCGAHLREQESEKTATIMCQAALRGNNLLLSSYSLAGASLNGQNFEGRTPLHMAILGNQVRCAEYLICNHVNVNIPDAYGKTAKELASESQDKDLANVVLKAQEL